MPSRMIEYSEMLECKLTQELIPTLPTEKHRFELVPETYFAQVNCKFDLKMATVHDLIPLDHPSWFNERCLKKFQEASIN